MGKIAFIFLKTFKITMALFAIVVEVIFIFAFPLWIITLMHNDAYALLFAVSVPLGIAMIITTINLIEWEELFDFEYCDDSYSDNNDNGF